MTRAWITSVVPHIIPQTQGKIERWHQTMKNRVLLENYYLPGDLERQIGAFVDHYNNQRYHESLAT
jgi:putative transposase